MWYHVVVNFDDYLRVLVYTVCKRTGIMTIVCAMYIGRDCV